MAAESTQIATELKAMEIKMKSKTEGQQIIESLNDALRYMKGETVPGIRVTTVQTPILDVKNIRQRLKLSQTQFASKFGFSVQLVRNWEQGINRPAGAARVLLAVIARHPDAVEDALGSLRRAS